MMARRGVFGLLIGGFAVLAGGCGALFPARYRFRLTVIVETPQGIRTGSSIYEVTAARTGGTLPEEAKRDWSVRGEAVAVDLPDGRTLFALLKTGAHFGDMAGLSMSTLYPAFAQEGYDVVGVAKKLASGAYPGPAEVDPDDYPILVTFDDVNDPQSVRQVAPGQLPTVFGRGVSLRTITVEVTHKAVTAGIREKLPSPSPGGFFNWDGQSNPNSEGVYGIWDFIQGDTMKFRHEIPGTS
jgi:hypothetical protein